eukprot:scpid92161/ scgid16679/ 
MIDNSKNSSTVATTKKWIAVLDEYCQKRHTPIDFGECISGKVELNSQTCLRRDSPKIEPQALHKEAISTSDQDTLQEYFTKNHTTDPIALAEMNWFVITQHFCLRGREMQSGRCIEDFLISRDKQ